MEYLKSIGRTQMKDKFCVKKKTFLLIAGIFYSGLGLALASAGIIFTRNYLFYRQLIEKREDNDPLFLLI